MCIGICLSGADDDSKKEPLLERTSSISEEYMRYLNNPENEEKRFPVDRKKLERLIVGESSQALTLRVDGRNVAGFQNGDEAKLMMNTPVSLKPAPPPPPPPPQAECIIASSLVGDVIHSRESLVYEIRVLPRKTQ